MSVSFICLKGTKLFIWDENPMQSQLVSTVIPAGITTSRSTASSRPRFLVERVPFYLRCFLGGGGGAGGSGLCFYFSLSALTLLWDSSLLNPFLQG